MARPVKQPATAIPPMDPKAAEEAQKELEQQVIIDKIVKLIAEQPIVELAPGTEVSLADGSKVTHDELIASINPRIRLSLTHQHKIVVEHGPDHKAAKIYVRGAGTAVKATAAPVKAKASATDLMYFVPPFYSKLMLNFKCGREWAGYCSRNVLFYGHKGAGKTSCVRKVAEDCGFGRVYQQNGTRDMTVSTFLGSPTLVIDETSMQSYVSFRKGPLYLALIHGTELDASGNQILYNSAGERVYDDTGRPKVVGAPAIYFLDEFSVVQPAVLTSVFNRALEIPDNPGESRSIEISMDGGRVVKSHPGAAVIFASNLLGKGIESDAQAGYTGQNNQHDDSTLDRLDVTYEFGYDLSAEKNIMTKLLVNDKDVDCLTKFVSAIRNEWSLATIETLLSTRQILQLCKQIRLYREGNVGDAIGAAFYDVIFSNLREKERHAWNQSVNLMFGMDVLRAYENVYQKTIYIPRRANAQII